MKDNINVKADGHMPATAARIRRVDPTAHDILTVAINWLPYGGPPDDELLVKFGLTRERYLDRLCVLVRRYRTHIHPETAAKLLLMCISVDDESASVATRAFHAALRDNLPRVATKEQTAFPPSESTVRSAKP